MFGLQGLRKIARQFLLIQNYPPMPQFSISAQKGDSHWHNQHNRAVHHKEAASPLKFTLSTLVEAHLMPQQPPLGRKTLESVVVAFIISKASMQQCTSNHARAVKAYVGSHAHKAMKSLVGNKLLIMSHRGWHRIHKHPYLSTVLGVRFRWSLQCRT